MALFKLNDIRLAGLAAAVPQKTVYNRDYAWISKKERELLIKSTGVEAKRVIEPGTATSDLCYSAAIKLIDELNWDPKDIGILIFVSQTRDYLIPATSGILQERLGLPKSAIVMDINQGCSGYVYGLATIGSLMQTTGSNKALLLVGDISSLNSAYKDKSTYPLFGDAGTASAIEIKAGANPMYFNLQGDGKGYDAIIIPDGGFRNHLSKKSFDYKKYGDGIYRNNLHVALNGMDVFNFTLREVPPNVKALFAFAEIEAAALDHYVFHQANKLIIQTITKMLRLDKEKVPLSINKFGNTSSASVPLTMISELRDKLNKDKVKLLLSAFGIGLSWGSVIIETDRLVCPELVEYSK
jgi:3-oxoacyl-[acyl-carrier-protein] synthase III